MLALLPKLIESVFLSKYSRDGRFVIPNAVYVELLEAERIGFTFTEKIFKSQIEITTILDSELIDFKNIVKNKRIHHGEAEGIAIARNRNGVFLTNDRIAVRFCEQNDVKVLDLKDILRIAARKKIINEIEMIKLIKDIEVKDNTIIVEKDEILQEYGN